MSLDVCLEEMQLCDVYSRNITHNLAEMAEAAGIYMHLWRPEEIGITKAKQLIEPLTGGLDRLNSDPAKYKAFNPENGWGSYYGLVSFVREYIQACKDHPNSQIRVSR